MSSPKCIGSSVVNCFKLPNNRLGARAEVAPDLSAAFNQKTPRKDKPPIPKPAAAKFSPLKLAASLKPKPLTDLQRTILEGVAYRLGKAGIAPLTATAELTKAETTLEADAALARHEIALLKHK